MFDLLPYSEKKSIKVEYGLRRAIVALGFLLATIISGIIFLVPPLVISSFRLREVTATEASLASNASIKKQQEIKLAIQTANKKLDTLASASGASATGVLTGIAAMKSADMTITSFDLARSATGTSSAVTVKGMAKDRETLLAFANKLKSDPAYASVDLPISNFAKDTNISFTLTVTTR